MDLSPLPISTFITPPTFPISISCSFIWYLTVSYRSFLNERHVLSYLFSIHFVGQYFLQNIARCRLLIRSSRVRSSLSLNSILFRYPFSFFLLLLFSISRRTIFFFYYLFR